jgi:glycosyltransferase involved in cell wall biosynthesis
MKTILHSIDTRGPGGAETVFIDLATRLPEDAYRAVVVIRGKGWVYDELCRRGVRPLLLPAEGSFNRRYLSSLVRLIRQEKVDLIQSHLLGTNVYCSLAGLLTRRPVVATFHGTVDIGANERYKRLKFAAINRGASRVVAVSGSLKRALLASTRLSGEKTTVIYNGIRVEDFDIPHSDALRRQYGWSDEDIIVGSLGNIRSAKGYDILLRAAAELKQGGRVFRFVIAGHGKPGGLYDNLLRMREDLGLQEYVHFTGFCERPAEFLSGLDLFLLSSTSEGFSLATIQAMAAGLPVVVTRSGGPEEIVTHGKNGWIVDAADHTAISRALEMLAGDHELRKAVAQEGRKNAAEKFDIAAMLTAYERVYSDLW